MFENLMVNKGHCIWQPSTVILPFAGMQISIGEPNLFTCPCFSTLLAAGADVNAVNKIGKSALIYAASEDQIKCLEVLANAPGVDINMCDVMHNQWNALHYAVLQDSVRAVEILIGAGADKEQKDGIGRTPHVIAGDHFKEKVLTYLNHPSN